MTRPVDEFFRSIQPIVDDIVTKASASAIWLNRTVQNLTYNLPPNVVPVAQLALTVAPFIAIVLLAPRKLTVLTLGAAAVIGFLAVRN